MRVAGVMSGTSLDGIDAALIESDGRQRVVAGPALTIPYESGLRQRLREALGGTGDHAATERALTEACLLYTSVPCRRFDQRPVDAERHRRCRIHIRFESREVNRTCAARQNRLQRRAAVALRLLAVLAQYRGWRCRAVLETVHGYSARRDQAARTVEGQRDQFGQDRPCHRGDRAVSRAPGRRRRGRDRAARLCRRRHRRGSPGDQGAEGRAR